MFVPYIKPQENGNRCEVKWLRIEDGCDGAIEIESPDNFNFSIAHFNAKDYCNAEHINELERRNEVYLNIDCKHRGLGTNSCGPDTLPKYRFGGGRYSLSFSIEI